MTFSFSRDQVISGLNELTKRNAKIFESNVHKFCLNPPLSEESIREFEQAYRILLPHDYRHFLTAVGNGGAGPFYGIFPLGHHDGVGDTLVRWKENDGFIGTLSMPFLLRDSWNDLSGRPSAELLATNQAEYDRQIEKFDAVYFDSSRMNGALPICHMGCALRVWLVVTGEKAGYLWRDGRSEQSGVCPLFLRDGSRAQFASWYAEWLQDALVSKSH